MRRRCWRRCGRRRGRPDLAAPDVRRFRIAAGGLSRQGFVPSMAMGKRAVADGGKAGLWTALATLGERVPPAVLAAALVLGVGLAALGVTTGRTPAPEGIAVLAVAAVAIGLVAHLLNGRSAVIAMAENLDGKNAQTAFAELLARAYEPTATTIYAVTSGYTEESMRDKSARERMHRVMDRLDQCLSQGVTVIRLQVEPYGPLSSDYVDRVSQQLRGETKTGTRMSGETKIYDMRDLPTLPSMAVIQGARGRGVVFHVLERLHRDGGRVERRAELVWEVRYDERNITPLLRSLARITEQRVAITTEHDYRNRIVTPSGTVPSAPPA